MAEAAPPAQPVPHRWIALAVLALAQAVLVLDSTVVNVALPSIQDEFDITASDLAWIVNCYALAFGGLHGYRNAQATVLAPTGTIGLLMDCDTTGVEPDFALVKFKKLAGGGYFKIVNQSVPKALERLGYDVQEIDRIIRYAVGHGTLVGAPHINESSLHTKGLNEAELHTIEKALPNVLDIRQAFGR